MSGLELTGNSIRMNVSFRMVDILLRRLLFQNYLIENVAMTKNKKFHHRELQ